MAKTVVKLGVLLLASIGFGFGQTEPDPSFPAYQRTASALEHYRALDASYRGDALPPPAKTLSPGDDYSGLAQLTGLLRLLGDLPPETSGPDEPTTYSGTLVEAVKRFQDRHGLEPDGRIGKTTIRELNVPLRVRVRQLELALERFRRLPREFDGPSVWVNLPEFRLRALDASFKPVLDMKIIAGTPKNLTPLLSGEFTKIVFRSYWNVPLSIVRKELLPEIMRDPAHMTVNNYEVTTQRGEIVATSGPLAGDVIRDLQSGRYMLRQRPGPQNALGLIKFSFPNTESIYLHDTPGKDLFKKARRDFSHGCIRVERAPELAAWLLANESDWTAARIRSAMNGTETLNVKLRTPVPVVITYITAVVLESGEVRFFDDLYGYDADLERKLAKK